MMSFTPSSPIKPPGGGKGALVAMVKGTLADRVEEVLSRVSLRVRKRVQEVTLDMAANMNLIVKRCFPFANRVIDRFHIQQLAAEAVQEICIKYCSLSYPRSRPKAKREKV